MELSLTANSLSVYRLISIANDDLDFIPCKSYHY